MSRTPRAKSATGIYHVVMRGINKQQIFEEPEDYQRFLTSLSKFKGTCEFEIYAYCLMDNHIHLLLKEGNESLGETIKRIAASYVYWYNWKYQRSGHLFQDRFKSEPVETDAYLITVIRYIHQNPVVAGISAKPTQYLYSSFNEFLNQPNEGLVDLEKVYNLVDREDVISSNSEESAHCLDADQNMKITDKVGQDLIRAITGCKNAFEVQGLEKVARNQYLAQFRSKGLSIRQISRLTGISYGVIRKFS